MSLTRSNEVSDSPLQRKSSSILLLFRGKGVLRLCRTTTAISCAIASLQDTQSFLMKKRPRGCSFFPKASMRRIWSVRQPPTMNTRALRSTGAYRLSGEAPAHCRRPHSNHRCSQATLRVEQSETNSVGARGFIPLTR